MKALITQEIPVELPLDNQLTGSNAMESEIQLIGISESFKKT